jgi:23S rRNA pseudouridine2605 synthase
MSSGRVTVNGQVATELGTKVDPLCDRVAVDGRPVAYPHAAVTLMLNKPTGYLTTMSDPYGRPCVAGLVPLDEYPGLFPVGRLDADTTGLLLFSTDGELGHRLTHPRHHVWKTYEALVEGVPGKEALSLIRGGMLLDDGPTLEARAEVLEQQAGAALLQIGIREGRKRQVRRMCEAVGHPVLSLCRISLGPVALGDLPLGSWRLLTDEERESLG